MTHLTYIDALNMRVGVMDSTAMAMCMDNDLPIYVINLWHEGTLEKVVRGEAVGTHDYHLSRRHAPGCLHW